ncbi:MAG: S1 RNA-binding domain-containing protein [Actinomycetota bacterium]|nr:S1 RNA-binding domain-containing protein [Actinomycetota bacterium]
MQQLDEAVRAFIDEFTPTTVTVVVDASFPNRIDESEREAFEAALEAGELIAPPAGVIGRGDAFVLQIADRANAVILSNDSFQEFHGQYGWLFDQGRLVGGKPVPYVGWVFMDRSPVRGPLSRKSVSDAKKAKSQAADTPAAEKVEKSAKDSRPAKKATTKSSKGPTPAGPKQPDAPGRAPKAKLQQPQDAGSTGGRGRRGRGRGEGGGGGGGGGGAVEPYNDPLPFIEFVGRHPVGSIVSGEVERFASHGAYVMADGARCYLPLKHLGDPPPRSAREVLRMDTPYEFVVHAFDTPRRGVDLTMASVAPTATPATGAAKDPVQPTKEERVAPTKKKAAAKKAPAKKKAAAKKAPARKTAAKKAPAKKKAAAKKAPAKKKAAAKKAPAKKKAAAKKAPAKKKAAAKKAPAKKKAAAKKAPAKKKATAKKAPAKRR